jgi:hypothetical protein
MTFRQYLSWQAWLDWQLNRDDRTTAFLQNIWCAVRRSAGEDVRPDECTVEFSKPKPEKPPPEQRVPEGYTGPLPPKRLTKEAIENMTRARRRSQISRGRKDSR